MGKTGSKLIVFCWAVFLAAPLFAQEDHEVKHSPLDFAIVHVGKISFSMPVRVREFGTATAHLGKGKHRQQAEDMAVVAPGRLAEELLGGLRMRDFEDVAIAKAGDLLPDTCLVVDGDFTVLNPGSSTKRVLWGFGAGKTQVCIRGQVLDGEGAALAEFSHCRSGLGWGSSQPQMSEDTEKMGDRIAKFLAAWADGAYAE
jgi:hypothetical protein